MSAQSATSGVPAGRRTASDHGDDLAGYRDLLECQERVPEPRRRRGIRHRAAVVLAFAVATVLAGADSVTAISELAADAPRPGAAVGGHVPAGAGPAGRRGGRAIQVSRGRWRAQMTQEPPRD